MRNRSLPYLLVGMAQAAETVRIVLKEVRIHGTNMQAELRCILPHCMPIIFSVPGNVNGDTGTNAGDLMHLGRVCQLLAQIAGCSWPVKDLEARPGIAVSPRGSLDAELLNGCDDAVDSDTSLLQAIFDF